MKTLKVKSFEDFVNTLTELHIDGFTWPNSVSIEETEHMNELRYMEISPKPEIVVDNATMTIRVQSGDESPLVVEL